MPLEKGEAFGFKAGVSRRLQGRKGSAAPGCFKGHFREDALRGSNHAPVARRAAGGVTALAGVAGVAPRLPPLGSRGRAKQGELSESELQWNRPRNGREGTAGQQCVAADERRGGNGRRSQLNAVLG